MLTISIKHADKYYRARVTPTWVRRHDNGALISCGLTVGESLSVRSLARLQAAGQLTEVTRDTYNHSSCFSRCKMRGDTLCQW